MYRYKIGKKREENLEKMKEEDERLRKKDDPERSARERDNNEKIEERKQKEKQIKKMKKENKLESAIRHKIQQIVSIIESKINIRKQSSEYSRRMPQTKKLNKSDKKSKMMFEKYEDNYDEIIETQIKEGKVEMVSQQQKAQIIVTIKDIYMEKWNNFKKVISCLIEEYIRTNSLYICKDGDDPKIRKDNKAVYEKIKKHKAELKQVYRKKLISEMNNVYLDEMNSLAEKIHQKYGLDFTKLKYADISTLGGKKFTLQPRPNKQGKGMVVPGPGQYEQVPLPHFVSPAYKIGTGKRSNLGVHSLNQSLGYDPIPEHSNEYRYINYQFHQGPSI